MWGYPAIAFLPVILRNPFCISLVCDSLNLAAISCSHFVPSTPDSHKGHFDTKLSALYRAQVVLWPYDPVTFASSLYTSSSTLPSVWRSSLSCREACWRAMMKYPWSVRHPASVPVSQHSTGHLPLFAVSTFRSSPFPLSLVPLVQVLLTCEWGILCARAWVFTEGSPRTKLTHGSLES